MSSMRSSSLAARIAADADGRINLFSEVEKRLASNTAVPTGWRPIAVDLKLQLAMVRQHDPSRVMGVLLGRHRDDGPVLLAAAADDRVVEGMIRRANARASTACRVCGAPACAPPAPAKDTGCCSKHAAVLWLTALATLDSPAPGKPSKRLGEAAISSGHLRLPRTVVEVWLEHDVSFARGAARAALATAKNSVELDPFDAPAFLRWLQGLLPALEGVRRQQQRLAKAAGRRGAQ